MDHENPSTGRKKKSGDPSAARYHHGDLRAALLRAAEAELAERGVEAFSLRRVAQRAEVSHAAPAHHFGDVGGLLTALAAVGFRRFVATQEARQAAARPDPNAQLQAAGNGYVAFARAHPALFRLMFASRRPDPTDAELGAAKTAAYEKLVVECRRASLRSSVGDDDPALDAAAIWAFVHGVADLLISGRLHRLQEMTDAERDAALAAMFERFFLR